MSEDEKCEVKKSEEWEEYNSEADKIKNKKKIRREKREEITKRKRRIELNEDIKYEACDHIYLDCLAAYAAWIHA